MSTTLETLHALVDLRAIARGNGMKVNTLVERPEPHAPVQVRLSVMSSAGGVSTNVQRGQSAVHVIHGLIRTLQQANITTRRYQ